MPIEIKLIKRSHLGQEDLYCPFFVCDVCKQIIVGSGNYHYKIGKSQSGNYLPTTPVFFVHKKCNRFLETKLLPAKEQEHWCWDELSRLPLCLYTNLVDSDMVVDSPLCLYLGTYGTNLSDFLSINDKKLRQSGLYFLFENDELVYIGKSKNIKNRLKNHHIYKSYHKIRIAPIFPSSRLDDIEKALILLLQPSLNTVWNNDNRP